jgi:anaerobic selenocysteine-containing dehydrogenase
LRVPDPFLPFRDGFPTDSGRLEFVSARAAADGLDAVAGYVPPAEVSDAGLAARRPLALVSPASHFFMNSYFGNNAELRRRNGRPRVLVHPDDATAAALVDGEPARVVSDRGSFVATVVVTDKTRPGTAVTAKGYWAKLDGSGTHVNDTVAERSADMAHGAVFHDTRVSIEPLPLDAADVNDARPPEQRATPARAGRPARG